MVGSRILQWIYGEIRVRSIIVNDDLRLEIRIEVAGKDCPERIGQGDLVVH